MRGYAVGAMIALGLMFGLPSAHAAGWTGCYIGVHAGIGIANTHATTNVGILDANGLGAQDGDAGAGAGCDLQMGQLVVGGFADWTYQNLQHSTTVLGNSGTFSLDNTITVGGRAGFLFTEKTMAYGLVGYNWVDASNLTINATSYSLGQFKGWTLGGGVETQITDAVDLRIEYRYSRLDSQTVDFGGPTATLAPDVHSVRVGISYKLGGLLGK